MEETIVLLASVEHLNTISILAKLISKHNPFISVVILTTGAATVAAVTSVTFHRLPAPALPPDATTDHVELIFETSRLNNPNILDALHEISGKSKIKAFIIDFFCNPSFEIPASLNIPTYFYVSCGGFFLCYLLYLPTLHENVPGNIGDLNDIVEIPGCPPIHPLDLPKSSHFRRNNIYKLMQKTAINMQKSSGIIVNSFDALEFRAKEALSNGLCIPNASTPPVYFVGPLIDKTISPNVDLKHECLLWLDSQPSKSVIFLCFGRRGLFSTQQLKEIATGLENSGHRFLWALRVPHGKKNLATPGDEQDLNDLLPKGFVERTKDKGLVFVSWAPQKEILGHGSVAGFVTHCGRSSILEALCFGVPMIGWPLYAEQRLSRVCMVEEMKVALTLAEAPDGSVGAGELEKRVKELMDSETGRAVRRRVVELKVAAQAAVGKNGSSLIALERFIESVTRS